MKTLISMVQFVLEISKGYNSDNIWDDSVFVDFAKIELYAQFLCTPLKLGMFIPCDEDGNVLEKPIINDSNLIEEQAHKDAFHSAVWHKAKDRVLFDGFESCQRNGNKDCIVHKESDTHFLIPITIPNKTIESLIPFNLTLTNNAFN
jgi:hypothetical protein